MGEDERIRTNTPHVPRGLKFPGTGAKAHSNLLKVGVLISGQGSNLQAIIDACKRKEIPAVVACVISNKPEAYGLERAKKEKIPAIVVNEKDFPEKSSFEEQIISTLWKHEVDLVALAGFMKILSGHFINAFRGRLINIHPALLPSFPGLHGQQQAFDYGVKVSGCTVHFVDEGCDTGPVIVQKTVPVLDNDTLETLSQRILEQEHKAYPEAIKLFAESRLEIQGRKVIIKY
jgi:phosphoribosylglycinamide formyltransferase 1